MKNKLGLFIYYLVFLLIYVLWEDFDNVTNSFIRMSSLLAISLPCYFFDKRMLPAVMMLFLTLCTHGLTSAFLPVETTSYLVLLLVGLFVFGGAGEPDKQMRVLLFALIVYISLINFVTNFEIILVTKTLIVMFILSYYIDFNDEESFKFLTVALILASLLLSVTLLINQDKVMTIVGGIDDKSVQRGAFRDINYSACVVSLGMITALIELVRRDRDFFVRILSITTLVVSLFALALNASRSSFASIAIAGLIILWFSRTKKVYKVLLSLAVSVGLFFMFTSEVFNLIFTRFSDGDITGNGRVGIWEHKLNSFSMEGVMSMFFGLGHTIGREFDLTGMIQTTGFHNDFLAFLVCYGIVGFVLFLVFFFFPVRFMSKKNPNKPTVIAAMVGLFVICMTLEPFVAGRFPYYFFWIYIIWLVKLGEKKRV